MATPIKVVTPDVLAAPRTRDETLEELRKLTERANSLMTLRQNLQQRLAAIAQPTERERELAKQLVELNARIRGVENQATTEQEALEGQGRGITLQSIAGQKEQIRKQASRITRDLALQRLAASEELQALTGLRQQQMQALLQREESAAKLFDDITGLAKVIEDRTERQKEQARNTLAAILESTKGARFTDLDQASQRTLSELAAEVGIPLGVLQNAMELNYRASQPQAKRELRTIGDTLYEVVQQPDGTTKVVPLVSAPQQPQTLTAGAAASGISPISQAVLQGNIDFNALTPTQRERVAVELTNLGYKRRPKEVQVALEVLDQIEELSQKVNTAAPGPLGVNRFISGTLNYLGAITQSNTDAALLRSKIGALSSLIRTLGEKGQLAEGDVERALYLIPSVFDSASFAKRKISELRDLILAKTKPEFYLPYQGGEKPPLDNILGL